MRLEGGFQVGFSRCCTRCSLSRPTKVSPHHSPTTGCSTNLPFKSISSSAVRITGGDSWTSRGSPETFTTPATPSVDWLLHRLLQALESSKPLSLATPPTWLSQPTQCTTYAWSPLPRPPDILTALK